MDQRTVTRFRKRAILVHWLHVAPFAVLAISGTLMLFHLTSFAGALQIRTIHRVAAAFFVIVPVLYSLLDPRSAITFLKEAFQWHRDDLAWFKAAPSYYSGGKVQMPPQGYLNGDQRLWQLVVVVTGGVFAVTGVLQWFFQLKMPQVLYQYVSLAHTTAFVVAVFMFFVHFYLAALHPRFEESLSSMVDGKISDSYAQEHYGKWHEDKTGTR